MSSKDPEPIRRVKREYRTEFIIALLLSLLGLLLVGLILNDRLAGANSQISALQTTTAHLESEVMTLVTMQNLAFQIKYMQNGTCAFGFPKVSGASVQSVDDFTDYVELTYSLKEILLTPASIPLVTLEISATPRPIVFNGYVPPVTLPSLNELKAQLALFSPGINQLDTTSISENGFTLPYSYFTASKINISPNCPALGQCHKETGFSPRFPSSFPTYNSVLVFPDDTNQAGTAVMQFTWGQLTYSSIGAQYNFAGTSVEFTDKLDLLVKSL